MNSSLQGRVFPGGLRSTRRQDAARGSQLADPDEFPGEASCLPEQRLLVLRAMKDAQGVVDRPLFRHDRVWDFFKAATFAQDPDFRAEHVRDPRFRGAYLRIAETRDQEGAKKVRDLSITAGSRPSRRAVSSKCKAGFRSSSPVRLWEGLGRGLIPRSTTRRSHKPGAQHSR
jgi:hypothetical protein